MAIESASSIDQDYHCELCVVGAGYAALNGLNAAAKYLRKGDRVVFIDKNESWGGQWTRQYDFVRLHQPYRMFTAGDQPWTLKRNPSHLATRREVLDHLASVPAVSAGHLEVKPLFGHVYRGHRIREGRVEIDTAPVSADRGRGATTRIRARRLLKATGANIEMLPAFRLSSDRVRSVGVSDPVLMTPEFLEGDAPVYVIGSGKTAMDLVRHLVIGRKRRRPVHVLIGSGMWFLIRDNNYPPDRRRYFRGALAADTMLCICDWFDGQNEGAVMGALERAGLTMNVFGYAGNCRLGQLSFVERDEIRAAVQQIHRGHLVDVADGAMVMREGEEHRKVPVADGSWFINCTSHLQPLPYEPILQDGGVVCAPQFPMAFTGMSAYFMTHLWYRDELKRVAPELFRIRIDVEPKLRFFAQAGLMVMANMAMTAAHLPASIAARFLGDFNKWYPLYRQVPTIIRVRTSRGKVLRKAECLLKTRFSDAPDVG